MDPGNSLIKSVALWAFVAFGMTIGAGLVVFYVLSLYRKEPFLMNNHRLYIWLPLTAITCSGLVITFQIATGPIDFSFGAFKFSGAAGPIIMVVITFLAGVIGSLIVHPFRK